MQPYTNHLWELIELYPDKNWDWNYISRNPNITWEIIQDNPDKDWDWGYISYNKFEKDKSIVTRNQKKGKRWIINYIDDKRLCPTAIAELIGDFVY